jgi:hypothetical protein
VDQDGRELVQAVEDKAVLPHHYGQHEDAHGQDIVGLQDTTHVSHHALIQYNLKNYLHGQL